MAMEELIKTERHLRELDKRARTQAKAFCPFVDRCPNASLYECQRCFFYWLDCQKVNQ